jgi:hypothetical protein
MPTASSQRGLASIFADTAGCVEPLQTASRSGKIKISLRPKPRLGRYSRLRIGDGAEYFCLSNALLIRILISTKTISRTLPWMPKASIHFSRRKSLGVTCDTITSEQVSFLISSPPYTEALAGSGSSPMPKKHLPLLSRCGNLCVPTMWFASIAATGGKPCAATLAADTA